eukprot:244468-Alexandrium_andersonii.AAC.1
MKHSKHITIRNEPPREAHEIDRIADHAPQVPDKDSAVGGHMQRGLPIEREDHRTDLHSSRAGPLTSEP